MKPRPPIFLVSRFRSGSSFLWNLFRQDEGYLCFYEPLHDNLIESIDSVRPGAANHRGVTSYWDEYKPIRDDLYALHEPQFGLSNLLLGPGDSYPALEKFVAYLISHAERQGKTCVIKCNRLDFRLPWLRQRFPDATIVHIRRNPRDQWISSVRPHPPETWDRLEENRGYDLAAWIASLAVVWPFLITGPRRAAYYYSYLLWKLSLLFGQRFADVKLDFDTEIAEDASTLRRKLAQFFPGDFFQRPNVQQTFAPSRPGVWHRHRSADWFSELEGHAEKTLRRGGAYRPAFWGFSGRTPAGDKAADTRRGVELALLMFSRHRGEMVVHGHNLQESLKSARQYAESLKVELDKSSQALRSSETEQKAADYKLRLLQAVYDSLKQAHELAINSLNKTLEEFQFTSRELRQLITYKDQQLEEMKRLLPGGSPSSDKDACVPVQNHTSDQAELVQRNQAIELIRNLEAERQTSQSQLAQLSQELDAVRRAAAPMQGLLAEKSALESRAAEFEAEIVRIRRQLDTAVGDRVRAEGVAAELRSELGRARVEVESAREIRIHATTLEKTIGDVSQDAELMRKALRLAAEEKAAAASALAASESACAELRAEALKLREERDRMGTRIAELENRLDAATAEIGALQTKLERTMLQAHELDLALRTATSDGAGLAKARDELQAALTASLSRTSEIERRLADSTGRSISLTAELQAASGNLKQSQDEITALTSRSVALEKSLKLAEAKVADLESRLDGTQSLLAAEKSARVSEKRAFDQRSSEHVGRVQEAFRQVEIERERARAAISEVQSRLDAKDRELAGASERLAAIEQSMFRGIIRRLAPAAFEKEPS